MRLAPRSALGRYGMVCAAVAIATAFKLALDPVLREESPFLLYFAAVVVSALAGGTGAGVFAAACSAMIAAYFFFPPDYSFAIADPRTRVRLVAFLLESVVLSALCGALRSAKRRAEEGRASLEAEERERQRLFAESEGRRRAAQALAEVGALISRSLDPREVQQRIVESVRSLFRAERAALFVIEDESSDLVLRAVSTDSGDPVENWRIPRGTGLIGLAVRERRPRVTQNILTDPGVQLDPAAREYIETAGFHAVLAAPLLGKDSIIGALSVTDRMSRIFSDEDVRLAQSFADQAAIALENSRLYSNAGERAEKLVALSRVTKLMTSAPGSAEVFRAVAEAATTLLGAGATRVWVDDPTVGGLRAEASFGLDPSVERHMTDHPEIPYGQGLVGRIFEARSPEYVIDVTEDPRAVNRRFFTETGLRGFAGVPLVRSDRAVGVLAILFREGRRFTDEERELMGLLGDQAAIAIENARLLAEERARRAHLTAVLEINKKIGTMTSREELLNSIADEAARLLEVDNSGFRLVEGDELVRAGLSGTAGETMLRPRIKVGESLSGRVFTEGRPLIVELDRASDMIPEHLASSRRLGYSTYLGVPVQIGSQIIGVFSFRARRPFTRRDQELAEAFAGQAAIAIEHSRLYGEAARRAQQMTALSDLGRLLSETLDPDVVARRTAESVRVLFRAHSVGVLQLEPDSGALRLQAVARVSGPLLLPDVAFPRGTGVAGVAVAERRPIVTEDLFADPRIKLTPEVRVWIEAIGYRASLAVPLIARETVIGALAIGDAVGRVFDNDEIRLAQAFADQAALALENARLYQRARRAYEELSRAQAQLIRGETLRALGELAAGAAHHLNNLLAIVLGRLQLALRKFDSPEIRREIKPAERAALDGADVVRRLAAFSRGDVSVALEQLDLNRLIEEVIELTRPRWQNEAELRGVRFDVKLEPGAIPNVAGEPSSLREVLVNLVLNAVDAMPDGGHIAIKTWTTRDRAPASPAPKRGIGPGESEEGVSPLQLKSGAPDVDRAPAWPAPRRGVSGAPGAPDVEGVYCEVSDTGVGMSPDVQQRAPEPFFTTKGVKSTGLGLSVSHGIIQRHGGELTIASVEGRGTTVTFRLPLAASAAREAEPAAHAATPPARILLIDDDAAALGVIADMLAEDGHTVVTATTGAEGLARLASEPTFDLVLTDLGMPGMTGWDVARQARASHPRVSVGLITGWGEAPRATPDERRMVDFILAKPVTYGALRVAIAGVRPRQAAP